MTKITQLPPSSIEAIQRRLQAACADAEKGIPGTTVVVVGKDGKELFAGSAGRRGYGSAEPMTPDNIFWIASCTKMVVGLACMQLVEQGKLSLDDAAQVENICPELKEVKVLQDDGQLVEKKRGITLRMLLSHTAGFGYTFFNNKLRNFSRPVGYDEFSGYVVDVMQPLVHQPGEAWEYGVNIDWAGIILERVTGRSLNDYLHQNIFEPLGLTNISMLPTKAMKAKLVYMNQRDKDGQLSLRDHLLRRALTVETETDIKTYFNSGGAGCFAKPQEYCQILATLLNDGTSPTTGRQLLRKETVDEMFRNQISELPHLKHKCLDDAKPDLTNAIAGLYPSTPDDPQGWGLTFMVSGGLTGRSRGTAHWAGLPNLWWWCDREKGVAGMVCAQVLPFADPQVLKLWVDVEQEVYKGLGL